MNLGLSLSLCQPQASSEEEVFDPGTLALSLWLKAPFAASPWVGTASDGDSATVNGTEGTNPPGVSSGAADFDGTNDRLGLLVNGVTTGNLGHIIATTASSGVAYVFIDAINTSSANARDNDQIVGAANTPYYGITLSSTGPVVLFHAFDADFRSCSRAITTGAWHAITWRHTGAAMQIGVNEIPGAAGGGSTAALADVASVANNVNIGVDHSGARFYDGKLRELLVSKSALSDANFTSILSYLAATYP